MLVHLFVWLSIGYFMAKEKSRLTIVRGGQSCVSCTGLVGLYVLFQPTSWEHIFAGQLLLFNISLTVASNHQLWSNWDDGWKRSNMAGKMYNRMIQLGWFCRYDECWSVSLGYLQPWGWIAVIGYVFMMVICTWILWFISLDYPCPWPVPYFHSLSGNGIFP